MGISERVITGRAKRVTVVAEYQPDPVAMLTALRLVLGWPERAAAGPHRNGPDRNAAHSDEAERDLVAT